MDDSYLLVYISISVFSINSLLWLFHLCRYRELKAKLGIPYSYIILSQDLTPTKGRHYRYKQIIGKPDIVAAKPILWGYCIPIYHKVIIIDVKSRNGTTPTLYETYQMNLYHLLVSKSLFAFRYELGIQYLNHFQKIQPTRQVQKQLLSKRSELIKIQRQL